MFFFKDQNTHAKEQVAYHFNAPLFSFMLSDIETLKLFDVKLIATQAYVCDQIPLFHLILWLFYSHNLNQQLL